MNSHTGTIRKADPYNVFWQTDDGPAALAFTLDQLGTWLRERGIDVNLDDDLYERTDYYRLVSMHHLSDWRRDFQARLVEYKDNGTWTAELTVSATEREGGWVRLSVGSSTGQYTGTPRLARYMLESGLFRDGGSLGLTPVPRHVGVREIEDLAAVLTNVNRQGLAFVAGCGDELPFDRWSHKVARWTRDVTGLGEVFVLDPPATRGLSEVLGRDYGVRPFTLRTYRPGVDPAVPEDARRHRYLSTTRLAESSDNGIARLLGRIAREHNAARPLPDSAKGVFRAFSRIESRILAKSLVEVSTVPAIEEVSVDLRALVVEPEVAEPLETTDVDVLLAQVEEFAHQIAIVRRVLGLDIISEENLQHVTRTPSVDEGLLELFEQELVEKQASIESLQDEVDHLRAALDEAQLGQDDEAQARSRAEDEVRWLRGRLTELQQWEVAHAGVPDEAVTKYPDSFEELVERLQDGELAGVVFTGDRDRAEELDTHDGLETAVRNAWDACLALADYVRFRRAGNDGGVHRYLNDAPSEYRKVSPSKHAPTESDTVTRNADWARERCLPVPAEVDRSGEVQMFAHFKCALVGIVSPRLHYYDGFSRTGKVYVGYIGRHLTTKGTN